MASAAQAVKGRSCVAMTMVTPLLSVRGELCNHELCFGIESFGCFVEKQQLWACEQHFCER